ncbi:MAG TPA: biotin/lipoyl-containing protein [Candidatus Angelobacter sp.]|jgi:biotin carboxyl carrier protein|nr:biotin/lipoyl-containing protein [Candidatus Angelobacter sp.]
MIYEVSVAGKTHKLELQRHGSSWRCTLDGSEITVDAVPTRENVLSLIIGGKSYEVKEEVVGAESNVVVGNQRFPATVRDPRSLRSRRSSAAGAEGVKKINAPMPGKVVRVLAPAGSEVDAGQGVIVIEAMKMQNELKSPKKGVVKKLTVAEGAAVDAGQTLAEVE